ncbi:hypothetical protein FNF27_05260 [Cafeteria roenbergensis]|uniref:WHIM1 domain-containing protein n=1 Tax=Cafeteria roenbergensis TaxID=33653 RepID=A0A5A8E6L4_CAFRO|nr:hypothetical protein FNF27_05260 [Cafeteria roenbergensis]
MFEHDTVVVPDGDARTFADAKSALQCCWEVPASALLLHAMTDYINLRIFTIAELEAGLESPGSSPLLDQLMLRMLFPRLSQCGSLALEDGADLAWWSRHLATLVCDWFERWGDLRLRVAQREGVPLAVAADDWTPEASLESRAQPLQSSDSGSAAASGGEASDVPRATEGDSDSQDADDDAEDEDDEDDDQALEEAAAIPEATDEEVAEEKYWSALLAGFGRKSPLERSALFSDVPPQTRARLLRCLLQWRLRPGDELGDALRAEASASDLRVDPIGPTSSGLELILLPQFPLDVRIYSQSRSPGSSGLEAPEGFCLAAANDGEADALAGSLATADLPAADRAAARALRSRLKAMRRMRESVEAAIEEETKEVQRRQAKQQLALPSRRVATRSPASDEGARGSGALAGVGGGRNGGTAVLSPEAVWAAYWESRRADEEARACLVAAVAARLGAEEARAVEDTVREALEDSPDLDMADPGVAQALTADCRSRAARELGMTSGAELECPQRRFTLQGTLPADPRSA